VNYVQPIRDAAMVQAIEEYLHERNRRDWLLFVAGTQSGLRVSDLLPLRAGDVRGKHLVLKEKKTRKRKWIRITPKLSRAFKAFTKDLDDQCFLFRSRNGGNKPITRGRAYQILRDVGVKHGIEHIGTHSMRKTFGWFFYQQTKDVVVLQQLFNHSDPSVTLRYIGIDQDCMDEAMSRFVIKS